MSNTAPAPAGIQFYNELVHLNAEAVGRAAEIEWAVRGILRHNVSDLSSRIALTQALMHQGNAVDAISQSEIVWPRRAELPMEALDTFQAQLIDLGMYDKARQIFQLLGTAFADADTRFYTIAFNTGDFEEARRAGGYMNRLLLDRLQSTGAAAFFAGHQAIVQNHLFGKQVFCALAVLPSSDSEGPEVSQKFYVSGTYAERCTLEQELLERITSFYAGTGFDAWTAWDMMTPMLMDVTSRSVRRDQ